MNKSTLLFLMLLAGSINNLWAQWVAVGDTGFSAGATSYNNIAIDKNGIVYVAFMDNQNSNKATAMKFTGTQWETLGSAGFSAGAIQFMTLALDTSGIPYVAYQDNNYSYNTVVMRFNGAGWEQAGSPQTDGGPYPVLAFDHSNQLYLAYENTGIDQNITVKKFDGSQWNIVGAPFAAYLASYLAMAIDTAGNPNVLYQDYSNNKLASVMKYNGVQWVNVGSADFSQGGAISATSMAIDKNNNVYVSFNEPDSFAGANGGAAIVEEYNGSDWAVIGSTSLPNRNTTYNYMTLDPFGTPYLSWENAEQGFAGMVVLKLVDTIWQLVGQPEFTTSEYFSMITTDAQGVPYVAYGCNNDGGKTMVKKFEGTTAITEVASPPIDIYPNPSAGLWQLTVSDAMIGSIAEVFDGTGQLVFTSQIRNTQSAINIPNLANGIYELRITGQGYSVVKKLVKM